MLKKAYGLLPSIILIFFDCKLFTNKAILAGFSLTDGKTKPLYMSIGLSILDNTSKRGYYYNGHVFFYEGQKQGLRKRVQRRRLLRA